MLLLLVPAFRNVYSTIIRVYVRFGIVYERLLLPYPRPSRLRRPDTMNIGKISPAGLPPRGGTHVYDMKLLGVLRWPGAAVTVPVHCRQERLDRPVLPSRTCGTVLSLRAVDYAVMYRYLLPTEGHVDRATTVPYTDRVDCTIPLQGSSEVARGR